MRRAHQQSRMSVCKNCGSLDLVETYQEESRQLSWLVEDIAVLYEENSSIVKKIMQLNLDLENLENKPKFYEETTKNDVCGDEVPANDDELWSACQTELSSLERDIWLQKEIYLRERLMQQLLSLSQDISSLQPQHYHRQHHQQPHLPRHLWGHQTVKWCPPSPAASPSRTRRTRGPERLRRWIMRRMPKNLIHLQF